MTVPPPEPSAVDERATRQVPAPGLREVAETWWDRDVDPVVTWDAGARRFSLVDPGEPTNRLALLRLEDPADDPRALATCLAEGLAACDFPPTGERASPSRVRATLRAARMEVTPADDG